MAWLRGGWLDDVGRGCGWLDARMLGCDGWPDESFDGAGAVYGLCPWGSTIFDADSCSTRGHAAR